MGTKERREREKTDMRGKILSAARELFADKGYEAVTMREIADKIEYSPTAIYHHFDNKLALCSCLCEMDFEEFGEHFSAAARVADPIERLREMGLAYLRFAEEHPNQYRFLFMTPMPKLEPMPAIHDGGNPERDAYAMLRATCIEAVEKGLLRPQFKDPDELAQVLWAELHGLVSLRMVKGEQPWIEWRDVTRTAQQAMDMLFEGMRAEADVAK